MQSVGFYGAPRLAPKLTTATEATNAPTATSRLLRAAPKAALLLTTATETSAGLTNRAHTARISPASASEWHISLLPAAYRSAYAHGLAVLVSAPVQPRLAVYSVLAPHGA